MWTPVPGMYGGFSVSVVSMAQQVAVQAESWCRVVGGSGQRHLVTSSKTELTAEGFV